MVRSGTVSAATEARIGQKLYVPDPVVGLGDGSASGLRRHAVVHPLLEHCDLRLGPGFVTRHAAVVKPGVNRLGVLFDVIVSRRVHAELFHGVHIRSVAEQGANVVGEAESHTAPLKEDFATKRKKVLDGPALAKGRLEPGT